MGDVHTETRGTSRARIASIDLVRGLIMVLMALDHTRDFFGIAGQNPTDLATATTPLFLTRWVTHFCAPVFFLLTGTGAYLALGRRSPAALARFLLTRGVWLIFLEVVIVRCLAYQFNADFRVTFLMVLWALGWAMVVLAPLVLLPAWVAPTVGLALIAGHNLLDAMKLTGPLWTLLHSPGVVLNADGHVVFAAYPLIPWVGVTAAGFGLGQVYRWDRERRQTVLLGLGAAACLAFLVLRALNSYGDPSPWSAGPGVRGILSFLNTTKYPPSLAFLLMTLGPALLLLGAVDGRTPSWLRPALVIGKVPLFYYALHFALIHLAAAAACFVQYGSAHWLVESPDLAHYPFSAPPGWGYPLPVVYMTWLSVVAAMYPLCRWFAGVKQRRQDEWLSYL